jgi:hypothetical protein
MDPNTLRYGSPDPLPERIALRAGPLSMVYENGDLRDIRYGRVTLVRRLYAAVRDKAWGTVPGAISDVRLDIGPRGFKIGYTCEHVSDEIDFVWRASISGTQHGVIEFSFDGQARSTFLKNRIGFCILHPDTTAGAWCEVEHIDGSSERARLPKLITPDQPVTPFAHMRAFKQQLGKKTWLELRMLGEAFEMEDQRNWTDASFKTFCTPLSLPFPVEIEAGAGVSQHIRLTVTGADSDAAQESDAAESIHIHIGKAKQRWPRIGFGAATHGQAMDKPAIKRIKALNPAHLRVDLNLKSGGFVPRLTRAITDAKALGCPLEIGLLIPADTAMAALAELRKTIDALKPPVVTWLIYPWTENVNTPPPYPALIKATRAALGSYDKKARFAAGSNADFIFASRFRRTHRASDAFCAPSNPQTHAFDVFSIAETAGVQRALVETARKIAGDKPVLITPISLRPRWNAYVPAALQASAAIDRARSDLRQVSLFGAGWTLASIKAICAGGADSVTYFETTGHRGLMTGGDEPDAWPLSSGVYPMYCVFADIAAFGGAPVECASSQPLAVEAFAQRAGKGTQLLLANLTNQPQTVLLHGLGPSARLRLLDDSNAESFIAAPEAFLKRPGTQCGREVVLGPFAVGRVCVQA